MKPQLTDEQAQKLWDDNQRWGGDNLYEKLQNALCEIHTVMGCTTCSVGVRPSHAIHGMCSRCAAKELTRLTNKAPRVGGV